MDDSAGPQLRGTPAKVVALEPGPETKVQNNINTLRENTLGQLPKQRFYRIMPHVVLGMLDVLTEKAKMPFIRR